MTRNKLIASLVVVGLVVGVGGAALADGAVGGPREHKQWVQPKTPDELRQVVKTHMDAKRAKLDEAVKAGRIPAEAAQRWNELSPRVDEAIARVTADGNVTPADAWEVEALVRALPPHGHHGHHGHHGPEGDGAKPPQR